MNNVCLIDNLTESIMKKICLIGYFVNNVCLIDNILKKVCLIGNIVKNIYLNDNIISVVCLIDNMADKYLFDLEHCELGLFV